MSMNIQQVSVEIARLLALLPPEQLEALYNQLHTNDPIVHIGGGLFEHQDMDD
ncbi:hypothetical protein HZU75_16895 [Chitinibacter fontanus]|uniref:Uncharacterized protein n=1 Tax=Chitinibacter fontanus TaxID=1737446 RepID=A0A7D5Z6S9_9NEIS|nr:hypothetical protein [Chitinibacter fontanus]QLI83061.1 hypothetical protein HZU75_16895 [Chitinibacter fontanus]